MILPVQYVPSVEIVKPGLHSQRKLFGVRIHRPFRHLPGMLHSSISETLHKHVTLERERKAKFNFFRATEIVIWTMMRNDDTHSRVIKFEITLFWCSVGHLSIKIWTNWWKRSVSTLTLHFWKDWALNSRSEGLGFDSHYLWCIKVLGKLLNSMLSQATQP